MTKLCNTCEYLKYCARSGIEDVGCDRYKMDTTTNEEWFCRNNEIANLPKSNIEWMREASLEELAGAIYEWHTKGYTKGRLGLELNPITEVVEWLKQPHTIKE